jgi:hypothetical protein
MLEGRLDLHLEDRSFQHQQRSDWLATMPWEAQFFANFRRVKRLDSGGIREVAWLARAV